ncbi:MAG: hypothetical protein U1E89_05690 [Burkholderiaceae bacterium]
MSAKPDALDRLLIRLAWAGPALLVVVLRWQMSLDQWYVPLNSPDLARMSNDITEAAGPWLSSLDAAGGRRLFLLTDPNCACTPPAILRVKAAMAEAQQAFRSPMALKVIAVDDRHALSNVAWRRVVQNIPATPSLIVVDGNRLHYVGPAVSGSLCIADANVTGLFGAGPPGDGTTVNFIDKGCFCTSKGRLSAGRDAGIP